MGKEKKAFLLILSDIHKKSLSYLAKIKQDDPKNLPYLCFQSGVKIDISDEEAQNLKYIKCVIRKDKNYLSQQKLNLKAQDNMISYSKQRNSYPLVTIGKNIKASIKNSTIITNLIYELYCDIVYNDTITSFKHNYSFRCKNYENYPLCLLFAIDIVDVLIHNKSMENYLDNIDINDYDTDFFYFNHIEGNDTRQEMLQNLRKLCVSDI